MIKQKPTTLEALFKLGNNFCEAYVILKIIMPTIQTIQTGLTQTVYQNPKQNSFKLQSRRR